MFFPKVSEIAEIVETHKEALVNDVLILISNGLKKGLGAYPLRISYYTDTLSGLERLVLSELCVSDIIPFIKDQGWDVSFIKGSRCFVFTISPATKGE
jgi:hypothetical protein